MTHRDDTPPKQVPSKRGEAPTYNQWRVAQLAAYGFDSQTIANNMGLHLRSVYRLRRSPAVKAQLARIVAAVEVYREEQRGKSD